VTHGPTSVGTATGQPSTDYEPIPAARIVFTAADRREIAERINASLASGALTLGANTREFEDAFAHAHDAPYAIAVTSGTAALEIILRAVGVAGREVVVPANTFAATAFAVLAAGGIPVFADVVPATAALSPGSVADLVGERTAAVVLVHIGGLITPEIGKLRALCDEAGVAFVEDAAHAHGCRLDGTSAGSFGVAGAFSFYPTKVITTGEGGMIVTADEALRDAALSYRDQGKESFLSNLHTRLGYAWRMSELHAAVGAVHLKHLAEFVDVRTRIAQRYAAGLAGLAGLTPLDPPSGLQSSVYKYPVLLDERIERATLKARVRERFAVALSGEVYETPLHQQPVFAELARGPLPGAELFCARHICLPLHSDMTDDEADRVLGAVGAVSAELLA
jgi:dTDP-4-amino-4,6-dideoxygalactose transaminase